MKKVFLFQKNLFDHMLTRGLGKFSEEELKALLQNALDLKKIQQLSLSGLIEQGVCKKTALMLSAAYELGLRHAKR